MSKTIHKLQKHIDDPFTRIHNESFNLIGDPVAAAIWVYLMMKPDDWTVRRADVCNRFGIGRDRYRKALSCLRQLGLLWTTEAHNADGKLAGRVTHVSAVPVMIGAKDWHQEQESNRGPENPSFGTEGLKNRPSEKPNVGKSGPLQTKELLQTKDSYKGENANKSTRAMTLSEMINDRGWID